MGIVNFPETCEKHPGFICRSLPLMGIVNKLGLHGSTMGIHRSHYPSWGS